MKSPKKSPKPEVKKPGPARYPERSGPARPKPGYFRPVTSLLKMITKTSSEKCFGFCYNFVSSSPEQISTIQWHYLGTFFFFFWFLTFTNVMKLFKKCLLKYFFMYTYILCSKSLKEKHLILSSSTRCISCIHNDIYVIQLDCRKYDNFVTMTILQYCDNKTIQYMIIR